MTKSFNEAQEDREATKDPEAIFKRTLEWRDRSNQRIEQLRKAKADKASLEETFKPAIKQMISERQYNQISDDPNASLAKKFTIPEDNSTSREAFRNVPGISKFLEKQFVAMC